MPKLNYYNYIVTIKIIIAIKEEQEFILKITKAITIIIIVVIITRQFLLLQT